MRRGERDKLPNPHSLLPPSSILIDRMLIVSDIDFPGETNETFLFAAKTSVNETIPGVTCF